MRRVPGAPRRVKLAERVTAIPWRELGSTPEVEQIGGGNEVLAAERRREGDQLGPRVVVGGSDDGFVDARRRRL